MNDKNNKHLQSLVISSKTIFLIYVALSFAIAYENVVVLDPQWGTIYSVAILFALPYLVLDYILSLLKYTGAIKSDKIRGILIFDLLIDHAPKFPTKDGFVPDWKGYALQIVIGILLFMYFWGQTASTGEIFAGTPSFTAPAQLSPTDKATKSGIVAIPEDTLSTTLTSIIAVIIFFIFNKVLKPKENAILLVFVALLIGSYASSLYMADLHLAAYPLNENARGSIQKFFFVGNIISSVTGAQYAQDIVHYSWNKNIVQSGMSISG